MYSKDSQERSDSNNSDSFMSEEEGALHKQGAFSGFKRYKEGIISLSDTDREIGI